MYLLSYTTQSHITFSGLKFYFTKWAKSVSIGVSICVTSKLDPQWRKGCEWLCPTPGLAFCPTSKSEIIPTWLPMNGDGSLFLAVDTSQVLLHDKVCKKPYFTRRLIFLLLCKSYNVGSGVKKDQLWGSKVIALNYFVFRVRVCKRSLTRNSLRFMF